MSPSIVVVLVGVAACSFTPREPELGGDVDASVPEVPEDADRASVVPCATQDPAGLVLCLEFEDGVDDGVLGDSSPARRDVPTSGLVEATRDASRAARVTPQATARVPQDAALDLGAAYTIAMWIRPARLPERGEVFGLVDHEQQYAMLIARSDGDLETRCVHTGVARYEYTDVLPANEWSFVACTFDGATLCASRWTSPTSHERFCHAVSIPPSATGAEGLAIGHLSDGGVAHSRFDGALDSLQIYRRGMTEAQLCALIGRPAGCLR